MRNFFQRLSDNFRRFMVGRYGSDQLSRFMMMVAVVMLILNLIFGSKTSVFYWLVWILLILSYLRMFSKNIEKRYNENTRFLQLKEKVLGFFRGKRNASGSSYSGNYYAGNSYSGTRTQTDREHRLFRCPKCSQRVRVPRGRGRIEITCPRCGNHFIKRS